MQDYYKAFRMSMVDSFKISNDFIATLNKSQDQIRSFAYSFQDLQRQINLAFLPLRETIERFNEASSVYKDFSKRMNECLSPLRDFATTYNLQVQESIQRQFQILESLSRYSFDTTLSQELSEEFLDISTAVVNEINEFNEGNADYLQDVSVETEAVLSSQPKKMTWQEVLMILSFIIALLSLVQSCIPDKRANDIERHVEQLIDIENKQLELMQKSNE